MPTTALLFFLLERVCSDSLPPRRKLHHDVVDPSVPAGGLSGARLVVVVGVDVDEQTSLVVGVGQHPRVPHCLPPVRTLVLPVGAAVVGDCHLGAVYERALT